MSRKRIKLRKDSKVTKDMVEELDSLFSFASPGQFQSNLIEVFLDYALMQEHGLSLNYRENVETFYYLFRFLKVCEQEIQHSSNKKIYRPVFNNFFA